MGNKLSPCFHPNSQGLVKLVFWGGTTRFLTEKQLAGELMFQFPDQIVCHADSFYIGQPLPVLSIEDELVIGETYFVLPVDRFPCDILSAAALATLSSSPKQSPINFGQRPFQYLKGVEGRTLIKVLPEFITRIISDESNRTCSDIVVGGGSLCTTPELIKHYSQLVGSKGRAWKSKLETIPECKIRSSPARLLGLQKRKGMACFL